jgi:hypothetical protein
LRLKPSSEGGHDYIALVPLDFRRPERHAQKSSLIGRRSRFEDIRAPVIYGHHLDSPVTRIPSGRESALCDSGSALLR